MAQFQRKKTNSSQKSYPGCMGIMVNLFDLNFGVSGNKLLTEKPHRDGSDVPRSQAQLPKKTAYPDEEYAEEKPVTYESRTCPDKPSNGTPMKMLLAQEMSKEIDPKGRPPSVVARLMGLDAIPAHDPLSSSKQSNISESYLRSTTLRNHDLRYYLPIHLGTTHPGTVIGHQHGEIELKENYLLHKTQSHTSAHDQEECKDVYEVWQSCRMEKVDNQSLQKVRHNNHLDERKMDLVRQKFLEAKRLATDEKLRQSKEFQDALEVLSSNRELFLKFLQEPNSLFSQHLSNWQSIPPPSQTKRITVLKPSKAVTERGSPKQPHSGERWITSELKSERLSRIQDLVNHLPKRHHLIATKELDENRPPSSAASNHQTPFHVRAPGKPDGSHHPTRIVVLKPSPKKAQDIRMVVSSPPLSPRPYSRTLYASSPEKFLNASADDNQDLQVRHITSQIRESVSSKSMRALSSREETFLSSTLSNGYVGDESSHSRSENEYAEGGNLSDSEIMTPTSRYSWDFLNRCSPYSSSSISRASYSSESSVTKEAKKRLSERWALMANGNQERHSRRSSSTLGEMLAIPEAKKTTDSVGKIIEEIGSTSDNRRHAENDGHEPGCVSGSKSIGDGAGEGFPRNLLRSKSVPVSSKTFDSVRLEDEVPKPEPPPKPITITDKPKSAKSLKGKVSSLFFSKNKKASKEKCDPSAEEETSRDMSELRELCKACPSTSGGFSVEAILSRAEPRLQEVLSENQEQPSPVSVLELPFEDEAPSPPGMDRGTSSQEGNAPQSLKVDASRMSSLESMATTLSWEDPSLEDQRNGSASGNAAAVGATAMDEQEQFDFVQKVICSAGLDTERPDEREVFDLWYSSKCPLDPSLLDKLNDQDTSVSDSVAKDSMNCAKLRRAVLERRLLFDCTNSILLDMAGLSLDVNPWSIIRSRTRKRMVLAGSRLAEEVWRRLSFPEVVASKATVTEGRGCVDEMLRKEVEGREWDWLDMELVEVDAIGQEIENDVLNDLIEDTISDTVLLCCR